MGGGGGEEGRAKTHRLFFSFLFLGFKNQSSGFLKCKVFDVEKEENGASESFL